MDTRWVRWATMWHVEAAGRTVRLRRRVTWCGRQIPPGSTTMSERPPEVMQCEVCRRGFPS